MCIFLIFLSQSSASFTIALKRKLFPAQKKITRGQNFPAQKKSKHHDAKLTLCHNIKLPLSDFVFIVKSDWIESGGIWQEYDVYTFEMRL